MEQWRTWRYGLFIHWGPYSKLAGSYEGKVFPGNTEWIMGAAKISREDYRKASADFDPKNYDPEAIVAFAKKAGFRYIILTAKHYDGFALFDSKASDFDAVDILPSKRDLIKEFAKACEDAKMPFGFSYALNRDWYHPGGDIGMPSWDASQKGSKTEYLEKVALPQVQELTRNYGQVSVMMFDNGPAPFPRLASRFIEAVGPQAVTSYDFIGRTGGDYLYTDSNPIGPNYNQVDWEQCKRTHDSWGYRSEPARWRSPETLLKELVSTATRGGNYLLNIGLDGDGAIPPQALERLDIIGSWLRTHGDSVYGSSKTPFTRHPWNGGATLRDEGEKGCKLYLHFFESPGTSLVLPDLITQPLEAKLMGTETQIPVSGRLGAWKLDLSKVPYDGGVSVVEVKLPTRPVIGVGPISSNAEGNYSLRLGRATLSGQEMTIGRTAESANLRVTGFTDESNSATWEIHVDEPSSLRMVLEGIPSVPETDMKLVLSINGKKIDTFGTNLTSDKSQKFTDRRRFISKFFALSGGINRVTISGPSDVEQSSLLTVTHISLQKK